MIILKTILVFVFIFLPLVSFLHFYMLLMVNDINKNTPIRQMYKIKKSMILSVVFANSYILINLFIPSNDGIVIPEIPIYSSNDDDRIWYEKPDKYETFYKYIKRKFKLIRTKIYDTNL